LQTYFIGLGGESSALVIVEPGLFPQLLLEDFDLLLEVFDNILLVAVDPTSSAGHEELKGIHVLSMKSWARRGQTWCAGAGHLFGLNGRIFESMPCDVSFRTVRGLCSTGIWGGLGGRLERDCVADQPQCVKSSNAAEIRRF
jgi:hypothetical protein